MSFFGLIWVLIIGGLAGWLAGRMVAGYGFGILGNIVVGVIGAFVAQLLFPRVGLGFGGGAFSSIVQATLGAVLFLLLIRMIKRI